MSVVSAAPAQLKINTSTTVKRRSKNDLFTTDFRASAPHVRSPKTAAPPDWHNNAQVAIPITAIQAENGKAPRADRRKSWNLLNRDRDIQNRSVSPAVSNASTMSPPVNFGELPNELQDFVLPEELPETSALLRIRLCAQRPYLLGVGQHSSVYLASYCNLKDSDDSANWKLCAAKQINGDKEAQLAALQEAYILTRLEKGLVNTAKRPNIIKLLAVAEERDLEPWEPGPEVFGRSRGGSLVNSLSSVGLGLPAYLVDKHSDTLKVPSSPDSPTRVHSRSSSEAMSRDPRRLHPLADHGLRNSTSSCSLQSKLDTTEGANIRRAQSLRDPQSRRLSVDESPGRPEDSSHIIMLLELCPKGNVAALLRRQPHIVNRGIWFRWAKQIAAALCHCHSMSVLHGDVKSQNIMLLDSLDAYLTDFGMSIPIQSSKPPTEGLGIGTTVYNAPELVKPSPYPFGLPADVFSFGVTLNVLLTGREPYFNCRSPVEQMLWVGRGAYWEWETRRKLGEIGSERAASDSGLSASRAPSIRSVILHHPEANASVESFDSARSYVKALPSSGPGNRGPTARAISYLLMDDEGILADNAMAHRPISSLATEDGSDDEDSNRSSPLDSTFRHPISYPHTTPSSYSDGAPLQYFLSGSEPVPEGILRLIQKMTMPRPELRPTMKEVVNALSVF